MALDASIMKTLVMTKLTAAAASGPLESIDAVIQAICEGMVEHIQSNAMVIPVLLVAPPGGGPVTGTGKVE